MKMALIWAPFQRVESMSPESIDLVLPVPIDAQQAIDMHMRQAAQQRHFRDPQFSCLSKMVHLRTQFAKASLIRTNQVQQQRALLGKIRIKQSAWRKQVTIALSLRVI